MPCSELYPNITQDAPGLQKLFRQFSFPGGRPSHAAAETPGSIHEGGELGYSLAHAFGAVLDNPDLIAACVEGDGEAEAGPLEASWHSNKFVNPARDGAVLPILHLNGAKIAGPTFLSRIPRQELSNLLQGYGYEPHFVPRWPMIVLMTPKGWTGPKDVEGKQIEGTFRAHQVPIADIDKPKHLLLLEQWMRSPNR